MMQLATHILFIILFTWLAINILYLLIASIAGVVNKKKSPNAYPQHRKIAVLITSHKEDDVIVNTIRTAVQHDYPADKFDVYLAADHLAPSILDQLQNFNVHVSVVNFPVGSKARSLNHLLNKINSREYEIALVLDGDNVMMPGFLEKINAAFHQGFKAVQAHRTPKNENTGVAVLDGISEEVNNHLFRKAQTAMGFSCSLIGSGMAFEFETLKTIYNKPGILDNPACDREVDFEMMKKGITVKYVDDAILLDEKVSKKSVFENQRRRWLESQMSHVSLFFSSDEKVEHKSKDYWNKLFINLIPPRIFFIAIFLVIFLISTLQYFLKINITGIHVTWWILLFFAYIASILLSIPSRYMKPSTLKALSDLPSILFSYLKAAFTVKPGRKDFVHTPKSFTGKPGSTENKEY